MAPPRVALLLAAALGFTPGAAAALQRESGRESDSRPPEPLVHESWTVQDGLPVNGITALLQSRAGYIWVATWDGLARFDGVRFTVFNSANAPGLPGNRIITLYESRDSTLWLRTDRSQLVRFRDGRFTHLGPEHGLSAATTTLHEDGEGVLWVGTWRGLGRIEAGRFVPVAADTITDVVTALAGRRDGSLWIGTLSGGLYLLENGRAERLETRSALDSASVHALFEDPSGRLWLATNAGLFVEEGALKPVLTGGRAVRDGAGFMFSPLRREVSVVGMSGIYRLEPDRAVLLDPGGGSLVAAMVDEGALWYGRGLVLYRDHEPAYALRGGTASGDAISSIIVDHEGSVWFSTSEAGLHRVKTALFTTISAPEGLAYRSVYTVYQDGGGTVWVGTRGGGLSRIETNGSITNYGVAQGFPHEVSGFHSDRPDHLWVGSFAGLLSCTLPAMICRQDATQPVRRQHILALYGDAAGRLWAGTTAGLWARTGGRWHVVEATGSAPVRAFAETRDGALWMGTNGAGLLRYQAGRFTRVASGDGLPSDRVRSLYADADGWLWIGTEDRGLARLDPLAWADGSGRTDRRIARIGTAEGLYDEVIHQILEDGAGRVWMSTNRGIFWVRRAALAAVADGRATRVHSTSYTERDGMRNREANGGFYPAGIRARDGRLWFPTQDGVVVVDPERVTRTRVPPAVVIERVVANDTTFAAVHDRLELGVHQRDLQIEYTALSFLEPHNLRFRYRLDPYDADWIDAGGRRTAFYTRVPPGRYTFRVSTSNVEGVWDEAGASLQLHVAPRFRETALARLLLLAAVALLVAAGFQWRLRNLRRRAHELTRLVDERTAALRQHEQQLEAQNAQLGELHQARSRLFANLSHEFRTPLTLILGPLRSLLEGRHGTLHRSAHEQGELMLRNANRLLRLINQVLDLAKLQTGAVTLDRRTHDLVGYARGATLAFAPLAERRGIALRFHSPLSELPAPFDAEQLEKVLLNLLSNALKFTPRGGSVTVSVGMEAGAAGIAVRDTGVGIGPAELPHVFERFYQADASATRRYEGTGIGLALAKELVELHGGEIRAESVPGAGSTFTVRLPLSPSLPYPAVETAATKAQSPPAGTSTAVQSAKADFGPWLPPIHSPDGGGDHRVFDSIFAPVDPAPDTASGQEQPGEEPAEDRTTVLVVDDNADVRAYVRSVLAGSYRVLEAGDGRAGLDAALGALPDLIVADVMMPELDGLALARALKDDAMTDAIPVVLLTARAAPEDQIAGLETGADAYLVKPFDPGVLEACVANLLATRRRLRERFRQGEAVLPATIPATPSALDLRLRPLVEAHLTDADFNPEELAAAAGLSYHQLYRALREELDTTPSHFIRTVRVECAAALLRQGAGSVTEVAYSVGFESLSYFRRAFRERFAASPTEHLLAPPPAPHA